MTDTSKIDPPSTEMPTLLDIRAAAARIAGAVSRTPFLPSLTLSEILGCRITLKFENLQFTSSFKERGALNRLLLLTPDEAKAGVVAVSAGNHAQGLAWHARRLGIAATVVMPETAPAVKVMAVRRFGAEVILSGATFADAAALLPELMSCRGLTLVHPFDDAGVVAGQGTCGLEMLEDDPTLDTLVVPIGGGGLISGIAIAARALKPAIHIIGVQTELYSGMARVFAHQDAGASGGPSVAEGIAVKEPGVLTRRIVADLVDEIVVAPEIAIEDAVALVLEIEKTLVEGAGAAGIAAIRTRPDLFSGRNVGVVLCGGNIDTQLLAHILDRALARQGRLVRLTVTALDAAGALSDITGIIARHGGNIREVWHDRTYGNPWAKTTAVDVEFELQDAQARRAIEIDLVERGFGVSARRASQESAALQ